MIRILIVDSDRETREKIGAKAHEEGYDIALADNGITALKLFRREEYGLVILDVFLPELDGLNVCRQIRKSSGVPVVFLTAKSRESDRLAGFAAGADDYVLKPFYLSELFARINALLNRCRERKNTSILRLDGITANRNARNVLIDGRQIMLSPREYDLLLFLMENPNVALSRDTILNEVWGSEFEGTDRTVDTHIRILREHIRPYSNYIVTVWGIGYKFEAG